MTLRKGSCPTCGARVMWAHNIKNRMVTLDAKPLRSGNVVIGDGDTALVYRDTASIAPRMLNESRYVEHVCEKTA